MKRKDFINKIKMIDGFTVSEDNLNKEIVISRKDSSEDFIAVCTEVENKISVSFIAAEDKEIRDMGEAIALAMQYARTPLIDRSEEIPEFRLIEFFKKNSDINIRQLLYKIKGCFDHDIINEDLEEGIFAYNFYVEDSNKFMKLWVWAIVVEDEEELIPQFSSAENELTFLLKKIDDSLFWEVNKGCELVIKKKVKNNLGVKLVGMDLKTKEINFLFAENKILDMELADKLFRILDNYRCRKDSIYVKN